MNIQFSINPHVFIHHLASQHLRYRDVAALCFWFPRTWHFPLGTFCSFNRDGYQYETKPQTNGGRGYAELLFFPTAEGYVKALYKDDPSDHAPAAYQYVYIYKDHLGNNRLSYTFDPETNQIKILEENHYYPFGLKHGNYNAIRKDVKYKEQAASKKEVKQVVPEAVKFKYYYQEQERQDELGLNWDSFKYRNYDYAIGRFMSVDPLAEKYPYNSIYAFQENKMGLGRELEGLELEPFQRMLDGAKQFFKGIFGAQSAYENHMEDPNNIIENQYYEDSNDDAQHVPTYGEAATDISEGGENMVKGAVQGTADTVQEASDDAQISLEVATVTYPPSAEVTVPLIAATEVTSDVATVVSASVDYSDGNMKSVVHKMSNLAIRNSYKKIGNKVGKYVTKQFKPNEKTEKNITETVINILSDWSGRVTEKLKDTFQW